MKLLDIIKETNNKIFSIDELETHFTTKKIEVDKSYFLTESECIVNEAIGNQLEIILSNSQEKYFVTFDLLSTRDNDYKGYTRYYVVGHNSQKLRKSKHYRYLTIFDPDLSDEFITDFLAEEIQFDWETESPHAISSNTVTYAIDKVIDWYHENFSILEKDWDKLNEWKKEGVGFLEFIL